MSIFGDIVDFFSSDEFFTIVGTVATAGQYGWVAGVLNVTGAQQLVLQEGMKAAAGAAGIAVQNYVRTGKPIPPNSFFEAWQGQLIYRTKIMLDRGKDQVAQNLPVETKALAGPDAMKRFQSIVSEAERAYRDAELAKRAILEEAIRFCQSTVAGPGRNLCRPDVVASAVNLAEGRIIFDTTDWDVETGKPVQLGKLTAREARDRYYEIVRVYAADSPEARAALEVFRSAEQREKDRLSFRSAAEKMRRTPLPPGVSVKVLRSVPVGTGAAAVSFFATQTETSTLGSLMLFALVTSPLWLSRVTRRIL